MALVEVRMNERAKSMSISAPGMQEILVSLDEPRVSELLSVK
jgi:hypothetical protein